MIEWISQTVKKNSIAEWCFLSEDKTISLPIIYYFDQGNIIFTPLTLASEIRFDYQSQSTIAISPNEFPSRILIIMGNIIQKEGPINPNDFVKKCLEINPKMSNFLKTKQQYLSAFLSSSIYEFNPTKIQFWDANTDEFEEIEVYIP